MITILKLSDIKEILEKTLDLKCEEIELIQLGEDEVGLKIEIDTNVLLPSKKEENIIPKDPNAPKRGRPPKSVSPPVLSPQEEEIKNKFFSSSSSIPPILELDDTGRKK